MFLLEIFMIYRKLEAYNQSKKTSNQTAIISDQVARDDVQEAQVSDQSAQASDQAAQVSDQVATPDIQPRPFADYQTAEEPVADEE